MDLQQMTEVLPVLNKTEITINAKTCSTFYLWLFVYHNRRAIKVGREFTLLTELTIIFVTSYFSYANINY